VTTEQKAADVLLREMRVGHATGTQLVRGETSACDEAASPAAQWGDHAMGWLRERLEWEDPKVRQSVGVVAVCLAILILFLAPNGLSLLGAGHKGSAGDIGLISDAGTEALNADDGDAGPVPDRDATKASGESALRKRVLEAGLVLDADLSSLFTAGGDSPIQAMEESRSDSTSEDTAEAVFPGAPAGLSFDQFDGGRALARPSSGFGNASFAASGLVGGGEGARAGVASDNGAVRSPRDPNQAAHATHALSLSNVDAPGADGSSETGLAFLQDNSISGNNDSTVTAYTASGGSTIVSDASGPDPFSGPNKDGLTSAAAADPAPVPEPNGLILFGSGLMLVARRVRRWAQTIS